ncbi:MAG: hypothetical protein LBT59_26655 [Clostridiales bacterium]|jgi:hypothetical protein|nr:hypothetical protein [Clostridiales bacterium]
MAAHIRKFWDMRASLERARKIKRKKNQKAQKDQNQKTDGKRQNSQAPKGAWLFFSSRQTA